MVSSGVTDGELTLLVLLGHAETRWVGLGIALDPLGTDD